MGCGKDLDADLCEICHESECIRSTFPDLECKTLAKPIYYSSDSESDDSSDSESEDFSDSDSKDEYGTTRLSIHQETNKRTSGGDVSAFTAVFPT